MILITSRNGKLIQDGELLKPKLFQPSQKYEDGDLSTLASLENIQSVCESLLELFIRPQGMKLKRDPKWCGYISMDVVNKFKDGKLPPKRSTKNLTRGWCYLASGVLHRFFFRDFDLYKVNCPFDKSGKDNHWWLQSKCKKYVIDLTEEQYLQVGINNIRNGGKRSGGLGHSYGMKTKNMSYIVASHHYPDVVDLSSICHTGYVKKYPELAQTLKPLNDKNGFDEKKHARIRKIRFHTEQHLTTGELHLETNIKHYWKSNFIEFDPNQSLENPIRLIEKESDKLYGKTDYFIVKELVLTSNQTSKKLLQEHFFKKVDYKFDANISPDRTVFEQTIRVRNGDHTRLTSDDKKLNNLIIDLDEHWEELKIITEKIIKTQQAFDDFMDERTRRNLLTIQDRVKRDYKNQMFSKLKFPDLPNPPWEKDENWEKNLVDPSRPVEEYLKKKDDDEDLPDWYKKLNP